MLPDTCILWTCTDPNCLHFTYTWVSTPHFTVLNIASCGSLVNMCVSRSSLLLLPTKPVAVSVKGGRWHLFQRMHASRHLHSMHIPRLHFTYTWVSTPHFTVLTIPSSGSPVSFQDYQKSELLTTFVWWEEVEWQPKTSKSLDIF